MNCTVKKDVTKEEKAMKCFCIVLKSSVLKSYCSEGKLHSADKTAFQVIKGY